MRKTYKQLKTRKYQTSEEDSEQSKRRDDGPWTHGSTSFNSNAQCLEIYCKEGKKVHSRSQTLHMQTGGN